MNIFAKLKHIFTSTPYAFADMKRLFPWINYPIAKRAISMLPEGAVLVVLRTPDEVNHLIPLVLGGTGLYEEVRKNPPQAARPPIDIVSDWKTTTPQNLAVSMYLSYTSLRPHDTTRGGVYIYEISSFCDNRYRVRSARYAFTKELAHGSA